MVFVLFLNVVYNVNTEIMFIKKIAVLSITVYQENREFFFGIISINVRYDPHYSSTSYQRISCYVNYQHFDQTIFFLMEFSSFCPFELPTLDFLLLTILLVTKYFYDYTIKYYVRIIMEI